MARRSRGGGNAQESRFTVVERTAKTPAPDLWDEAAGPWTAFVRQGLDYYRDLMNTPAMLRVLGPVRGLDVLDLACGEGDHTRLLARRGARVLGVDVSRKMIAAARAEEERRALGVRYAVANASRLKGLRARTFDLVTCFMGFMDIANHRGAAREVARVLRPEGRFVFSMPHPCFDLRFGPDGQESGWVFRDPKKPGTDENARYVKVDHYFDRGSYDLRWGMRRMAPSQTFVTRAYQRTLGDYVNAVGDAGLPVRRIEEPRPTAAAVKRWPPLGKHRRVPHSIVMECLRTG